MPPTFYTLLVLRCYLILNLLAALKPLWNMRKADDQMTDIPLTPSQRALLGLDPALGSTTPATTGSDGYITPPRYRRSSGSSFSGSVGSSGSNRITSDRRSVSATVQTPPPSIPGSRGALAVSPSSTVLTPFRSTTRAGSGSRFSPTASPLLHKAIAANAGRDLLENEDMVRRQDVGKPGGLSRSQSLREMGNRAGRERRADSPYTSRVRSPAEPAINYKWLYEKGARLPRSESIQF